MNGSSRARLQRLLAELDERNRDNVARTDSYLELYALSRAHGRELPWLLLAHLVSRNAGYLMTGLALALDDGARIFDRRALEEMFLFLERANYLIFYDAWHHVLAHLLDEPERMAPGRTTEFMRAAYRRYRSGKVDPAIERRLVFDLVENEQNYIERRIVHRAGFERARAMIRFFEAIGAERSLMFGARDSGIRVGEFASLHRRIATGQRMFDAMLADRGRRDELYQWARAHPHTGCRSDYGGSATAELRAVWPRPRVHALDGSIHAPPESDPRWP